MTVISKYKIRIREDVSNRTGGGKNRKMKTQIRPWYRSKDGQSWTSYWALTSQSKWKRATRQQAFISERGKGMLNAQEQKSFCSSEFLQRKERASFAKETVYSCVFWLHRRASLYCAPQGLCHCLTDWTSLTTLSQASRRTPFFQQHWLTSLSRFGNSLTIPDFFIIFLLSVSMILIFKITITACWGFRWWLVCFNKKVFFKLRHILLLDIRQSHT